MEETKICERSFSIWKPTKRPYLYLLCRWCWETKLKSWQIMLYLTQFLVFKPNLFILILSLIVFTPYSKTLVSIPCFQFCFGSEASKHYIKRNQLSIFSIFNWGFQMVLVVSCFNIPVYCHNGEQFLLTRPISPEP